MPTRKQDDLPAWFTGTPTWAKVAMGVAAGAAACQLVHAIRTLLEGSGYLSDDIGRDVVTGARTESPVDALSPRERHVLALIAAGHGSRDIADQLSISVGTVRKHRENLMQKLDLHSIAEVTSFAIRNGLYTPHG